MNCGFHETVCPVFVEGETWDFTGQVLCGYVRMCIYASAAEIEENAVIAGQADSQTSSLLGSGLNIAEVRWSFGNGRRLPWAG